MNDVPVPVVARLLGHADVKMTLRYAHLADREIEAAAERIGTAIARVILIDGLEPDYMMRGRKSVRGVDTWPTVTELLERDVLRNIRRGSWLDRCSR